MNNKQQRRFFWRPAGYVAQSARRGAAGLIINGGVRDVFDLESMGFPVFSKAIYAKRCTKAMLGSVNIPIVCAGEMFNPGDVVIADVADVDGVVVVRAAMAGEVADAAEKRESFKGETCARFAAAELGLNIYNMRGSLKKAGLKHVD